MSTEKRKTKGTPDSVDIHVGNRLKMRRSLLGYSQDKLADALGITFQQVQKYEKGLNRVSAGRLFQLSKILEVPVGYFYENIGGTPLSHGMSDNTQKSFEHDQNEDIMQKKETMDLLRVYYSINDEEMRKDILKFVKSMAKR